jgi:hypothetical protein
VRSGKWSPDLALVPNNVGRSRTASGLDARAVVAVEGRDGSRALWVWSVLEEGPKLGVAVRVVHTIGSLDVPSATRSLRKRL